MRGLKRTILIALAVMSDVQPVKLRCLRAAFERAGRGGSETCATGHSDWETEWFALVPSRCLPSEVNVSSSRRPAARTIFFTARARWVIRIIWWPITFGSEADENICLALR